MRWDERDEVSYKSEVKTCETHHHHANKLKKNSQSNHTRKVSWKILSRNKSSCDAYKQSCEMKEVIWRRESKHGHVIHLTQTK